MTTLTEACSTECAAFGELGASVSTLVLILLMVQCAVSASLYWPKDYGEDALKNGLETYDFVVIGAGSAGSVVASRLSEDLQHKVLLLEAGGDPPQESEIPQLLSNARNTEYTWSYFTEPAKCTSQAYKEQRCHWPRGKCLGGSGGINFMWYVRGTRENFDSWSKLGNNGWSYDEVLPYFEKSVSAAGNETHPKGYLTVTKVPVGNENIQDIIYEGSAQLGVPHVTEFKEGSFIGISNLPATIKLGERQSSAKGYLARVGERPNLHIIRYAEATKINFDSEGKRVESLSFMLRHKHEFKVNVSKELIISAGSINSPKLLMQSGIGPSAQLGAFGIPVLHDLPIGRNLQDHLMVTVFFKLNIAQNERRDMMADNSLSGLTTFVNTKPNSSSPYPDIEMHFSYNNLNSHQNDMLNSFGLKQEYVASFSELCEECEIIMVMLLLLSPKSIGKLSLNSKNYKMAPKLEPNLLSDPDDIATTVRGLQYLNRLEETKSFKNLNISLQQIPIKECDDERIVFKSDAYWRCYLKYFTETLSHQVGTVKMGPKGDRGACVDPQLRLHGVENLRIVDASIMPSIPSANTNAATIMIAEKASDMIKKTWL